MNFQVVKLNLITSQSHINLTFDRSFLPSIIFLSKKSIEAKQSKSVSIIEPFKFILKPNNLLNRIIHVLDSKFHLFDFSLEFFMLWFEFLQSLFFPFFFRSKFKFELIVTFLPFKFVLGSLSRWLLLEFRLLVLDLTILLHFHAVNFLLSFG